MMHGTGQKGKRKVSIAPIQISYWTRRELPPYTDNRFPSIPPRVAAHLGRKAFRNDLVTLFPLPCCTAALATIRNCLPRRGRNPSVAEIGVQLIARWNGEAAGFGGFTRWVQNCLPIFDGSLQETEVLAGRWRTAV